MKSFLKLTLYVGIFLYASIGFTKEPTVIVISMDGIRHDLWKTHQVDSFEYIEKQGIRADHLIPVYQSTTYPGHVSLATGVHPDKHGILHNSFYDREDGHFNYPDEGDLIDVKPIWVLAEEAGIPAAVFFWVGSETDWNNVGATYRKAPFDESISEEIKIKQIAEWLDIEGEDRPRLIMSYWDGTDTVAHQDGPNGPSIDLQIQRQNKLLGSLLNEIDKRDGWEYITLFVVSDHGMTEVSNYIQLREVVEESKIKMTVSSGPAIAHIFLNDNDKEQAKEIFAQQEGITVFERKNLPESYHLDHPTRTGDLVLITEAPNMFSNSRNGGPKGMHGYSPDMPDMWGIFYAMGAAIKQQDLGPVHQIDLAPTIAKILSLQEVDHMEGKPIPLREDD